MSEFGKFLIERTNERSCFVLQHYREEMVALGYNPDSAYRVCRTLGLGYREV